MNLLLNEQEALVQQSLRDFLGTECTPARVRAAEAAATGYDASLWRKLAELGWLGLSLPEAAGGQSLPVGYLGLLLEETGRCIAPIPAHSTLTAALAIDRFGDARHRPLLAEVVKGERILSFAVLERDARWERQAIGLQARREGDALVLSGEKFFVDAFDISQTCVVACRLADADGGGFGLVLVDTDGAGIASQRLVPMAKDSESVVSFDGVRVPAANLLGGGTDAVDALMDSASVLMASQMQGAARRAMEFAVEYVNQREAFGQPIGAFQSIQHLAADMLNAVDAAQMLAREAIWLADEGLPARVEAAQAKSFANERCLMVCRSAQQMHGGIGFMAEYDLNLWYRRVASWSLRCGTTREHRRLIAASLLDAPGTVRLGMRQVPAQGAEA